MASLCYASTSWEVRGCVKTLSGPKILPSHGYALAGCAIRHQKLCLLRDVSLLRTIDLMVFGCCQAFLGTHAFVPSCFQSQGIENCTSWVTNLSVPINIIIIIIHLGTYVRCSSSTSGPSLEIWDYCFAVYLFLRTRARALSR